MSVTIDYFFNSSKNLEELVAEINGCLGSNLTQEIEDRTYFFSRFMSMDLSLTKNDFGLVNDRHLDFENYGFVLESKTWMGGAEARPIQLPVILTIIYTLHRIMGITGMLVFEVELLLANYEERETDGYGMRLFDTTSQTTFVSFGAHLELLQYRLGSGWDGINFGIKYDE